ncbi:hypothetical protein HHK36_023640 [Tetracentron sinense]|uniref:Receptor-like serine/threonine-protein kinase n=1 Tax=Tetracentron sinense TaxID=13715 RepID=A0A835D615_TETSI|nr:hypothetical protein HHK36_023640 [Tetracentron sinense]
MGIRSNTCFFLPFLLLFPLFSKTHFSNGADTISLGQSLSGNQTITSKDGTFELGFFKPDRDKPLLQASSSVLKLSEDGNLVLLNQSETQIWSTDLISTTSNSTEAVLLDNGNLVLRDGLNSSAVIWQSFDYPTDTLLPGAKLGINKLTNFRQILTSWRNPDDPAPGKFKVYSNGTNQFLIIQNRYTSSASWVMDEIDFESFLSNYVYNASYVSTEFESYLTYSTYLTGTLLRFVVDYSGQMNFFEWKEIYQNWILMWSSPCGNLCGVYASCSTQTIPACECLQGFRPMFFEAWNMGDWSSGCVRNTALQCHYGGNDTFIVMSIMGFPANIWYSTAGNIEECELACLSNCSCTAYAYNDQCLIWQGDLINLRYSPPGSNGADFHYRVAISEPTSKMKGKGMSTRAILDTIAGVVNVLGIGGTVLMVILIFRRRKIMGALEAVEGYLVVFRYRDLRSATKNFSEKLGGGGFGSVYRGTAPNSVPIAVKKLESLQKGEQQFRNEVSTIGVIRHVNLVRLHGFCAEGTERLLVYEYMPNGSLDSYLFRKDSKVLDWKTRYQIVLGTAKGLEYLHEKCRDCIIHCDIKPGNILLDSEYNPKVADFGLAKLFGRGFSRVLTTMRGTRGYLAPEWISGEAVTSKADVYSYGMMLFEVISGRRNLDISEDGMVDYFPTRAVNKMNKGEEVLSLLDYRLEGNTNLEELTRACRVASWCIQDNEKNRPSMGHVVRILEGVLEVGTPPIPSFLQVQTVAENPAEN